MILMTTVEKLANKITPFLVKASPIAYKNMTNSDSDCCIGLKRPFSGLTFVLDYRKATMLHFKAMKNIFIYFKDMYSSIIFKSIVFLHQIFHFLYQISRSLVFVQP